MATTNTSAGARASRRAAARAAATAPVPTPTADHEALADLMAEDLDDQAAIDEAFGPDDAAPAAQSAQSAQAPSSTRRSRGQQASEAAAPGSQPTNERTSPVRASSGRSGGAGGGLALPMEDLSRKIDVGDMVIPKLRLSQAMSKSNTVFATSRGTQGVGMGNWYNSATGQSFGDTVYFIPVDMRKSRAYFVQGQGLMCRSFDMLEGQGDPGGMCEGTPEERLTMPSAERGCPLRHWNDKKPPKCGVTYNFPGIVVLDIDDPAKSKLVQVILQLRSTGTKAAREMITRVMNEGGRVWQNCVFELGVESQTNPLGTYFVPSVDLYDTTDAEDFSRIRRRADLMARSMGAVTTAAFEDGDND